MACLEFLFSPKDSQYRRQKGCQHQLLPYLPPAWNSYSRLRILSTAGKGAASINCCIFPEALRFGFLLVVFVATRPPSVQLRVLSASSPRPHSLGRRRHGILILLLHRFTHYDVVPCWPTARTRRQDTSAQSRGRLACKRKILN